MMFPPAEDRNPVDIGVSGYLLVLDRISFLSLLESDAGGSTCFGGAREIFCICNGCIAAFLTKRLNITK